MKTSLALIATVLFAASAGAADDTRKSPAAAKQPGAATSDGKPQGKPQKRAESSGDRPDLKEGTIGSGGKPVDKAASGSAAGETGGPAATKGHTGSTTNTSNSPGK